MFLILIEDTRQNFLCKFIFLLQKYAESSFCNIHFSIFIKNYIKLNTVKQFSSLSLFNLI